ncbi:MAG: hypothetical protein EU549_03340 [Promethearchaeota archaeon]|nr:MAG: hypothetical protein EU549_03340 [Candidatus Lokiarchaeota archaeon]
MANLRTEKIRCILCNKNLEYAIQQTEQLYICAKCQAYFCNDCRKAVLDYPECPAASLLGVKDHKLKFVKILPFYKNNQLLNPKKSNKTSIKILSDKKIQIINDEDQEKNNS